MECHKYNIKTCIKHERTVKKQIIQMTVPWTIAGGRGQNIAYLFCLDLQLNSWKCLQDIQTAFCKMRVEKSKNFKFEKLI